MREDVAKSNRFLFSHALQRQVHAKGSRVQNTQYASNAIGSFFPHRLALLLAVQHQKPAGEGIKKGRSQPQKLKQMDSGTWERLVEEHKEHHQSNYEEECLNPEVYILMVRS